MSDGITAMYIEAAAQKQKYAVEKLSKKGYEEIYLLLKDIQSDVQALYHDERMQLTRSQWAAFNRINQVVKELV
jgi:hypothetical protein